MADDFQIAPSKLGTKEYWDQRYNTELDNFQSFGDEGEIWFGASSENRMLKYICETSKTPTDAKILDIGCGNGSVLRKLRANRFTNLMGIDYCEAAVKLARSLAEQETIQNSDIEGIIEFKQQDILHPDESIFDIKRDRVIDKGTWDAMSLSDPLNREARLNKYKEFLRRSLNDNGEFIIFSCNFTIDELRRQFDGDFLAFVKEIPASHQFSFGGKPGVTSTGAVFVRK
ncbi:unnamed protein product [Caenorhabditis bovis]|uniref:Protein-lysine N-methyltransferase CBOVIS_LOCUS8696 n=1 Tax=Caenorhabditis bovis TaxID=2654633 RepID=A0A8S1F2K0_9PELO|nr:unnamed protein product [Caenorhabditis bovis]